VGGNGISFRGSGLIRDNFVKVNTLRVNNGGQIKYYPDHKTGADKQLVIKNNVTELVGSGVEMEWGVDLSYTTNRSTTPVVSDADWYVNDFFVQDNDLTCEGTEVRVNSSLSALPFVTITQSGNV
jgi:hypothetical protein